MSTESEAKKFMRGVLADLQSGGDDRPGNGTYVYDHQRRDAESFMLAGNGPSAWAWFVFAEGNASELDHAYIEYIDGGGNALVPIPDFAQRVLLDVLRLDAQHGVNRR